jgi:hypothetical protein
LADTFRFTKCFVTFAPRINTVGIGANPDSQSQRE